MVYRRIERYLAGRTDVLVAVSPDVRDDLVRLGVASAAQFTVIPLGFDLSPFTADQNRSQRRASLRAEWGLEADAELVTLIARLVPIKRVDRFLRVAAIVAAERPHARFAIVGDGELHDELTSSPEARALADRLIWTGFRRDIPDVCFASDVVVLTSDNEGTPVSLIEAQAAAVPVVGTDVGGVRSAVRDGETGFLAGTDDLAGLARSIARILQDSAMATELGASGRRHATTSYAIERLVDDHDTLYRGVLAKPSHRADR
jgi:glycosyltransferase involved in cell wall biosynthesis